MKLMKKPIIKSIILVLILMISYLIFNMKKSRLEYVKFLNDESVEINKMNNSYLEKFETSFYRKKSSYRLKRVFPIFEKSNYNINKIIQELDSNNISDNLVNTYFDSIITELSIDSNTSNHKSKIIKLKNDFKLYNDCFFSSNLDKSILKLSLNSFMRDILISYNSDLITCYYFY